LQASAPFSLPEPVTTGNRIIHKSLTLAQALTLPLDVLIQ
jgi:hypothetical protein